MKLSDAAQAVVDFAWETSNGSSIPNMSWHLLWDLRDALEESTQDNQRRDDE